MGLPLANYSPTLAPTPDTSENPGNAYDIAEPKWLLEHRVEHIRQLEDQVFGVGREPSSRRAFDRMDFASFFVMPFDSLADLMELKAGQTTQEFTEFLESGRVWLSLFLKREEELDLYQALDPEPRDQHDAELQNCKRRDGDKCLITGGANPVAAHIVPFATSMTYQNRISCLLSSKWLGDILMGYTADIVARVFCGSMCCSDKSWNMLSIDPEIHEHWRKARCGFKFLETEQVDDTTSKLSLEFRWLSINCLVPDGDAFLTTREILTMFDPSLVSSAPRTLHDPPMAIPSGRIVSVIVDTTVAAKMQLAIEMQWAIVRIAALSGAAYRPDRVTGLVERLARHGGSLELSLGLELRDHDE